MKTLVREGHVLCQIDYSPKIGHYGVATFRITHDAFRPSLHARFGLNTIEWQESPPTGGLRNAYTAELLRTDVDFTSQSIDNYSRCIFAGMDANTSISYRKSDLGAITFTLTEQFGAIKAPTGGFLTYLYHSGKFTTSQGAWLQGCFAEGLSQATKDMMGVLLRNSLQETRDGMESQMRGIKEEVRKVGNSMNTTLFNYEAQITKAIKE